MRRTDAPPGLPGASHLYGEEAKELALAPVPGSPATEPSGPVTKLDPLDHLQPQGGSPFGSRGTTSSGAFDISALRPATDLGLERREASAAPKKAQE
jgi:hypothetical protein